MKRQHGRHEGVVEAQDGTLLWEHEVRTDRDVFVARQKMKQIARLLGYRSQARTQLATASAEIIVNALNHAGGCRVRFYAGGGDQRLVLWTVVRDKGFGLTRRAAEHGMGIATARNLVDLFQINAEPGQGTTIALGKRLRGHRVSDRELRAVMDKVARTEPRSSQKEAQEQNRELMASLDALRRAREQESLRAVEWQSTFDAIPDALCLLDSGYRVVQANRTMVALIDRPGSETVGKPWQDLSPFGSPERPVLALLDRASSSCCRASEDHKLHNRWHRVRVDPLLDEAGRVRRFVLLIVDVTEEKRAVERLRQINEALKSYAHSISHDIKGPLAGAITANQVLQQMLGQPLTKKSSANIRELGDVISISISKTLSLINDVLALAETGAGPGGATSVRKVIERVLDDRQQVIRDSKVKVELDGNLGQVMAAPAHLYQVFGNLVDNAIKHTRRSDLAIHVTRLDAGEQGFHRFLFRDNGPGVPEGLQSRIFDSFVQADATIEGRGVGLATVKRIVETYNGTIRAYNDGGACFSETFRDGQSQSGGAAGDDCPSAFEADEVADRSLTVCRCHRSSRCYT